MRNGGALLADAYASRCATSAETYATVATDLALQLDSPLFRLDLDGPAGDRLAENAATGIVPAPLFQGQGTADEVVSIELQRSLTATLCAEGRTVETHEYEGRTHMGAIAEGSPLIDDLYAWADAVSAGGTPSNCG